MEPAFGLPSGSRTGCKFTSPETRGSSLAQSEVSKLFRASGSKLREAAVLISPLSKSTSSTAARGKPRKTISSRRIGKISSGRSAAIRRRAADSFDDRWSIKRSRLGFKTGLAILPSSFGNYWRLSPARCCSPHSGRARDPTRCFYLDFRQFLARQLRTGNQASQAHGICVLQVSVDGRHHHAGFDRDQVNT